MSKKNDIAKEYDFSKGKRGLVIPHKGKARITIWIDSDILEWFKNKAEHEGQGYQTSMNQALRNYIREDKKLIQEIIRETVRKEIQRSMKPMKISDALAEIIGRKPLPRTEVTKKLWQYIKKTKLQDTMNKRDINADANLLEIFGGKKRIPIRDKFQIERSF